MNNLSRYSSDNLKTFVTNFKDLAVAQDGQRGRIDVEMDPNTDRNIYKVKIDYEKPVSKLGRFFQAATRTALNFTPYGQSSAEFFKRLTELFQDAKTCIEDMQHETDAKKSKRLYRLKEAIQSSKPALDYLLKTFTTGSSNLYQPRNDRETTASQILKDYEGLAENIQLRAGSVNKASEEQAERHVLNLMGLLFPSKQPDLYAEQFNANLTIPYLSKKGVQTALGKQFGDAFIAKIFGFYELNKPEIEIISPTKVKCLIVSALANLNLEALQNMKRLGEDSFFNRILSAYPANVTDWSDDQLCECLARVRNFSGGWFKKSLVGKHPQFLKDLKFVAACRAIVNYIPIQEGQRERYFSLDEQGRRDVRYFDDKEPLYYFRQFGDAEFDAKKIAYALCRKNTDFVEGVLYPNFVNHRMKCLEAYKIVAQPGLYAIGAIPARAVEDKPSQDDPPYADHTPSLRVIFRGSADGDSWWRNLSPAEKTKAKKGISLFPQGPGSNSYEKAMREIHDSFSYCLKKLKDKFPEPIDRRFKVKLEGDSLAGTDVQRCLRACALIMSTSKLEPLPISAFELYAFSAPGVEQDVADEFVQSVRILKNTQFIVRYFMADDDVVPQFGQTFLGWLSEKSDIPDNLLFSKFQFRWVTPYTQGSCIKSTRENGCVEAVIIDIKGRLEAHKTRCLDYTEDKGVHCYSLLTRNRSDFNEIKIGQDMTNPIKNKFLESAAEIHQHAMSGLFLQKEYVVNTLAIWGGCAPED